MSIRNQNWYNLQSTRRYPLDDVSTGVDDAGEFIRDDIIVDCHIRFPSTLGAYLYVQGITVSAGIVTVLFGAVNNISDTQGTTICAVAIPQPVTPNINYTITEMVPGVSGWIAFGPGVADPFVGRYNGARQTLIQPRNARPYRPLPIPSIGKLGLATTLQGVVNLIAASPVTAKYETITHGGREHPAIVFRLDDALVTGDYNPLSQFLGPCAQRPESGTCAKQPIETINGVAPDCDGNIEIIFDGFDLRNFEECGGADIITDVGLTNVCREVNKPKRLPEFDDLCCEPTGENILLFPDTANFPPVGATNLLYLAFDTNKVYRWDGTKYADTDIVLDEYCWPDPTAAIDLIVNEELDIPNYPCTPLPVCVDFLGCQSFNDVFAVRAGVFVQRDTLAPPPCNNCGQSAPTINLGSELTNHGTYASAGIGGINIALLKNCATDWALGRSIMTEFKLGTDGAARNGGLILNYVQELQFNSVVTSYVAVIADGARGKIRVLRYRNATFTEELAVNYNAKINTWYRLYSSLNLNGNNLTVTFSLAELDGSHAVSGFTDIATPGAVTGAAGLFANQSATFFNKFVVQ
jgi:hypothetical protein